MKEPNMPTDFDGWLRLAAEQPEAFERLRMRCINEVIAKAPIGRRERLRRMQWRIDQERRRAPTPLAACVSLSNMMWDSVAGRNGLLSALAGLPAPPAAKILPFEGALRRGCRDGGEGLR